MEKTQELGIVLQRLKPTFLFRKISTSQFPLHIRGHAPTKKLLQPLRYAAQLYPKIALFRDVGPLCVHFFKA